MALFHDRLAVTVTAFTLLAGLWGLVAAIRRRPVEPGFWGIAGVGEIQLLAQGLLGVLLYLGGEAAQIALQVPYAVTSLFQGFLLFCLLGSDLFVFYRVRRVRHRPAIGGLS